MTSSTAPISWPGTTTKRREFARMASYWSRRRRMSRLQPRRPHSQTNETRPSGGSPRTLSLMRRYVASLAAMRFLLSWSMGPSLRLVASRAALLEPEEHGDPGAVRPLLDLELRAEVGD